MYMCMEEFYGDVLYGGIIFTGENNVHIKYIMYMYLRIGFNLQCYVY